MHDDPPLVLPKPAVRVTHSLTRRATSYARVFGLRNNTIRGCKTIGELKAIIKPVYREKAKRLHPDARVRRGKYLTGYRFREYAHAWNWLDRQPDHLALRHRMLSVPDDPVPDAMNWRPVAIPQGYQEDWSWLSWR